MIKLVALGAAGLLGYRFVRSRIDAAAAQRARFARHNAVAGGPLSENASLQSRPDVPPAVDPFRATAALPA